MKTKSVLPRHDARKITGMSGGNASEENQPESITGFSHALTF